jgi:hypothetical protein
VEVQLAAADPKILRYRLLGTAARIVPPRVRASAQQGRVVVRWMILGRSSCSRHLTNC